MRMLFVFLPILSFSFTVNASINFTQSELETASPHDKALFSLEFLEMFWKL